MSAQRSSGASKARATANDDSTRDRVMRAAIQLFAERGFNGTGIRDIAAAADLTTSTLYHYMGTKDDLLVEIMLAAIAPLKEAVARIMADRQDDPAACLAAIVETHVWVHASEPLPTLVTDTELRALSGDRLKRVVKLRDEYEGAWKSVIRAGVKRGVFDTAHPDLSARALLQMATGVSHWFSPSGKLRLEPLCREYADWALGMLRARDAKRPIRRADLDLPAPDHYLTR